MACPDSHLQTKKVPMTYLGTASFMLAAAAASCARADIVDSQHSLRVTFSVATPQSLAPDMLMLNLGTVTVSAPFTDSTASLSNGAALLGVATNPGFANLQGPVNMNPANCWRDPASPWSL